MELLTVLEKLPVNYAILVLCLFMMNNNKKLRSDIQAMKQYIDLKIDAIKERCDILHGRREGDKNGK